MVVDTETATLPFANEIARGNEEVKKKIAIAKPLVYDIGWMLSRRDGSILEKKQFLVAEVFSVPTIFNTAYYKDKRPLYLEMLRKGEITISSWDSIMDAFCADMEKADFVGAFNSMFDFKKAIPFTELYVRKLYSADYYDWERNQRRMCESIGSGRKNEKAFDPNNFTFRNHEKPLFDIWGMSCEHLLNRKAYKDMCIENKMLTNSGEYFKTSAEAAYRFMMDWYEFEEAHTALADVEIETALLLKMLSKHAVSIGIDYFPFRKLGYTDDYVLDAKKRNINHIRTVAETMEEYLRKANECSSYFVKINNKLCNLNEALT
jgi:hypothetical protein